MNNKQGQVLVALLTILWMAMIVAIFRGWTPGTSTWQTSGSKSWEGAPILDAGSSNSLEIVTNWKRNWFSSSGQGDFDSVVWKTRGSNGWQRKLTLRADQFDVGNYYKQGPHEIHSFDGERGRAILKLVKQRQSGNTYAYDYVWYDWDLLHSTGQVLQVCKGPSEPYQVPSTHLSVADKGTNLVSLKLPAVTNSNPGSITNADGSVTISSTTVITKTVIWPRLWP